MADLISVIIPAGGTGERFGSHLPKALVQLAGKTLIEHAVSQLAPIADQVVVAAPKGFEEQFRALLGDDVIVVTGGATRSDSVKLALAVVAENSKYVLVHDAARPLATTDLARRVIKELQSGDDAVIPGLKVVDTIKRVDIDGYVTKTPHRDKLRAIQTPQGFTRKILIKAHAQKIDATDDAALVEELGRPVKVILGEESALKITTPEDLIQANRLYLGEVQPDLRVGVGTDSHAYSKDSSRSLWLAGIEWPDEIGVDGHSDGDVAAHAICDALLSAALCGDLGSNFGTSRPEYAGAAGSLLLQETLGIISRAGYKISNVSVQVICNRPKIGSRREEAMNALSQALGGASVALSATTTDGLGLTGEGRGISAIATALLIKA